MLVFSVSFVYAQALSEVGVKKYSSDIESYLEQCLPDNTDRLISFDPEKGILTITDTPTNHVLIKELVGESHPAPQKEKSVTSSFKEIEKELNDDERKRWELEQKIKSIVVPAVSFDNVPVQEVIEQLANMTGIAIFIDSAVLQKPANVTFRTVAPLSLATLLDTMLETVGLAFKVEPELIRISTPKRIESESLITKAYRLKYGVRKTRPVELKEFKAKESE